MAHRRTALRSGALHALVLVALTACGNTDPPAEGFPGRMADAALRLPRTLSLQILPTGQHANFPTEGFGRTVAISGARIAVADYLGWSFLPMQGPHVDTYAVVDGAAVWTGRVPPVGFGDVCFGEAIGIDGDLLAIGEPCANGGLGEVHVYRDGGGAWVEEPPLAPLPTTGASRFGAAIAMAANRMAVGASQESTPVPDGGAIPQVGAAYVFTRAGGEWALAARLDHPEAAQGVGFGSAVSMSASLLAVSAPWHGNTDELGGPRTGGRTYLFALQPDGTWVWTARLVVGDGPPYESAGGRLAVCSGTVFVGGDLWTWPAVHGFRLEVSGWVEQDLLDATAPPNPYVDALACDGDLVAVGMPFASPDDTTWLGTARLYKKGGDGWGLVGEVAGSEAGERCGHAVALDNGVLVVGAPSAKVDGREIGIARVGRF